MRSAFDVTLRGDSRRGASAVAREANMRASAAGRPAVQMTTLMSIVPHAVPLDGASSRHGSRRGPADIGAMVEGHALTAHLPKESR